MNRDGFRRGLIRACLNDDGKNPIERERERDWQDSWWLDQLHWNRVSKTKLGWNQWNIVYFQKWVWKFQWQEYKINPLCRRGRWKKKRIRRIRWQKFGANAFKFVSEEVCVGNGGCIWRLWKWVWRILMKNRFEGFQGVRGLAYDSVTRLEKRIRLWKWGIWLSCIRLGISRSQRETSSVANVA